MTFSRFTETRAAAQISRSPPPLHQRSSSNRAAESLTRIVSTPRESDKTSHFSFTRSGATISHATPMPPTALTLRVTSRSRSPMAP